jgi:excisionase family DNA binding protein
LSIIGPEHGPDHGPEHGPEHGPDHGPDHGSELRPERNPEHGSRHSSDHGPERRAEHGPKRLAVRGDWVSLGEASLLLGVSAGTVRRWSNSGRLQVFTTPGGHRRFHRPSLEELLPTERAPRTPLSRSGLTQARLTRAYRHEAGVASQQLGWLLDLTEEQRVWFRVHGRRIAELLLDHLDATDRTLAGTALEDATAEAAAYGRMTAGLGLSLSQTVEGFLQFRRPFLHELSLVSRRRGFDATQVTELVEAAERAMDELLVASMAAHGAARGSGPRRGRAAATRP